MSTRLLAVAALATVALLALLATRAEARVCDTCGQAGTQYETSVNCRTVEVDGHARRYVVYVPAHRLPAAPSCSCSTAPAAPASSSCASPAGASRPTARA